MPQEYLLSDYFKIIYRNRKLILLFTIFALLLSSIYMIFKPANYTSSVKINLGRVDSLVLIDPIEARYQIIEYQLLNPILKHHYGEDISFYKFRKDNIQIETFDEKLSSNMLVPILLVRVKGKNSGAILNIAHQLTNDFLNNLNQKYEEKIMFIQKESNLSKEILQNQLVRLQTEKEIYVSEFNIEMSSLLEDRSQISLRIEEFEKAYYNTRAYVNSQNNMVLTGDLSSKITLLLNLENQQANRLINEKDKLRNIDKKISLMDSDRDKKLLDYNFKLNDLNFQIKNIDLELSKKMLNSNKADFLTFPEVLKVNDQKLIKVIALTLVVMIISSVSFIFLDLVKKKII